MSQVLWVQSLEGPETSVSTLVGGARPWDSWLRVRCVSELLLACVDGLGPAMAICEAAMVLGLVPTY